MLTKIKRLDVLNGAGHREQPSHGIDIHKKLIQIKHAH